MQIIDLLKVIFYNTGSLFGHSYFFYRKRSEHKIYVFLSSTYVQSSLTLTGA